jgi:hypothetical protein
MVVLDFLSQRLNRWLGPKLLRQSLKMRLFLGRGVIRDNLLLDSCLLIPVAQRLIRMEAREEMYRTQSSSNSTGWWNRLMQGGTQEEEVLSSSRKKKNHDKIAKEFDEESKRRVQILEKYLRPVLVPHEQWSDAYIWQFHRRFLHWVRVEYLFARHGHRMQAALEAYPELRCGPMVQKSNDTNKETIPRINLTSTRMVAGLQSYAANKDRHRERQRMRTLAQQLQGEVREAFGGGLAFSDIPEDADVSKLSLEDLLELAGENVSVCGAGNAWCEESHRYQLWTKEYIEGLGNYLLQRCRKHPGVTRILDMGAGDGLLTTFLRQHIKQAIRSQPIAFEPEMIAIDDGNWKISHESLVVPLSVEAALTRYAGSDNEQEQPFVIILCSWMPTNEDWTALFRQYQVSEYILIGEADDGQCGNNWETWGNPAYRGDDPLQAPDSYNLVPAPYVIDGYQRSELKQLLPYQFSRHDSKFSKNGTTVTFKRLW